MADNRADLDPSTWDPALDVAVNKLEPNYRQASALKVLIVTLALVAILAHSMQ